MAQAILLFAGDNVWSQELDRKCKYWIHGILLIIATVIIIVGNSIAFYYVTTIPHFSTAHGLTGNPLNTTFINVFIILIFVLGFISMLLVLLSFFFGFAAANPQVFKNIARPVVFKFFHNFLGIAGYVIGMISLILGYYTHWFKYYTSAETRIVASVATGIVTVWPLYAALKSCYGQFRDVIRR